MAVTDIWQMIKRLAELSFWLLVPITLFGIPAYYALERPIIQPYVLPFLTRLMSELMDPASLTFKVILYPGFTFVVIYAAFLVLIERKLAAKVQLRVGPQYAGRYEGVLQSFADMFKALSKEVIVPAGADRLIFLSAPIISMVVAGTLLAVVPPSPQSLIFDSPVSLLLFFSVISFSPLVILLAAWSSNNKFTLVGGLRALHQLVSYEIPMVVSTLGLALLVGSLSLVDVVRVQERLGLPFLLLQPLAALTFYITMVAELERIPFDIPEADSEIVAGWVTEYSGVNHLLLYGGAPVIKLYAFSGLFTTLFLGGWLGPPPIPPDLWFHLKTFLVILSVQALRAIYPRYRIDQLLRIGWGTLLMLALINLALTILLMGAIQVV